MFAAAGLVLCAVSLVAAADQDKPVQQAAKEIAGTAEFLRQVPKRFATLQAVDPGRRQVTLLVEGETLPKVWPLIPDAEVKVTGWWGRPEQLTLGDRVWVWFKTDRRKQPVAVALLADELSEQDIHGPGVNLVVRGKDTLTLMPVKGPHWKLKADKAEIFTGTMPEKATLDALPAGKPVYVQSAGGQARLVLDPAAFEARRAAQKALLEKRWADEGLPGSVAFAHTFSGELDFMLDHEGMRWGRWLKPGDKVKLSADPPVEAVVKTARPWRERTQLRLVANSFEQAELTAGQRLFLKMAPPPADVLASPLPPDLDRPRSKAERVEWFLASIYCVCGIDGDGCTGHFYTLASCNPNGCGMPNHMRQVLAGEIDKGKTDRQILEGLLKEKGPTLLRPHLMP